MFKGRQVIGVLLAAGNSSRMGLQHSKLLCRINGEEVLLKSLRAFESTGLFDLVVITCRDQEREAFLELTGLVGIKTELVKGGESRQESVLLALNHIQRKEYAADSLICVHDAARCFVSRELIFLCVEQAHICGAVTAAIDSVDTVYQADSEGILSKDLLQRDRLKVIQTPQVFRFDLLINAHNASNLSASDDAGLVAQIADVKCVKGEIQNKKITLKEDLT